MDNKRSLLEMTVELEKLLSAISEKYELSEDEGINEMFFNGKYKANEFCNTLKYILKKSEKYDSI